MNQQAWIEADIRIKPSPIGTQYFIRTDPGGRAKSNSPGHISALLRDGWQRCTKREWQQHGKGKRS